MPLKRFVRPGRIAFVTPQKESQMVSSHVTALKAKHAKIEAQLRELLSRPAPDDAAIQMLKKRKLLIKEELAAI